MPSKFTMIFEQSTYASGAAQRIGGYSESWYADDDPTSGALRTKMDDLCKARVGILPAAASIIRQRVQRVDARGIPGQATLYEKVYGGRYGTNDGDLPGMALAYYVRADGFPNHRVVELRGCPDSIGDRGEYKGNATFLAAAAAFFQQLNADWKFKAVNRNATPFKIVDINADGTFETEDNHGLNVGDYVRLLRCYTAEGHSARGLFRLSVAAGKTGTFANYERQGGVAAVRGKIRKDDVVYRSPVIGQDELRFPALVHREVGDPIYRFRGRRSAKS